MSREQDCPMGQWMTGALVVGTMIGSGIFMLPASLALLGVNAIIGWSVSSAGALCIAYSLASLSRSGGDGIQANIERELGATAGYIVAWAFWVSVWTSLAAIAIAGASALSFVNAAFAGPSFVLVVSVVAVIVFTAVNALGARAAGGVQLITVAIKLLPLVAVIALLAVRSAGSAPLEPLASAPVTVPNVATAVALTFFALLGFESATTPVGKVRDPARTIPRAIMVGTLFVALLYLFSSSAVQLLLPADAVAASPAPFAEVVGLTLGDAFAVIVALTIAVAAFGALNGGILSVGELGFAMALRGDLPAAMAVTRRGGTPVVAQIGGSLLAILLILSNGSRATASLFTFLILLTTAATLVVYLGGALAAWRLQPSPGARLALIGAFLFIAFAFYGSGLEAGLWCLALLAGGLVIRAIMHKLNAVDVSRRAEA